MSQPGLQQNSTTFNPFNPYSPLPATCGAACKCLNRSYPAGDALQSCPYSRQGILPEGSYMFTKEGAVYNYCAGQYVPPGSLYVKTAGPKYGVTMGACVPHASQSDVLSLAGPFTPYGVMGGQPRGCYL